MLSLYDAPAMERALTLALEPRLRTLISERIAQAKAEGLLNLTHLLVMEAGDTEQDVIDEVGFSPLVNPLDGERFGSANFQPWWDWLQHHDGWFELIVTVGNSGFAFVLFIQDMHPELSILCLTYAV